MGASAIASANASVYRGVGLLAVLGMAFVDAMSQDLPPPAERIVRQADSPVRWIVEAGKLKSRAKAAEAPAPTRVATSKPAVKAAAARPAERPVAAAPASPAAPAPPAVATPQAVVAVAVAKPASAPVEPPVAEQPAAPPVELELLEAVEPVLPDDIDAALETDAVLNLAILVLTDGSVGEVTALTSTHPAVDEYAIAAVQQWRFKPVSQPLVHHVELVVHRRR